VKENMLYYIIRRLLLGVLTLWFISLIIFSIIHFLPGDPIQVMFGRTPDPELIAIVRGYYGLDKPLLTQYLNWLTNIFKGDFGVSIVSGNPVSTLVTPRIGSSLMLTGMGLLISVLISFPSGIAAAVHHNTWKDLSLTSISLIMISIPEFWIGIVYMMIFSVWLGILPTSGFVPITENLFGFLRIIILPALTVASVQAAQTARMVRTNVLEVMRLDYVTLMRSLGVSEKRLMKTHVFKNVLIPVLTQIGMQAGALMGGVIIVERVFTYPGLGLLMMRSLQNRDYPVLQACIMVFAAVYILFNLIVDILYCYINPKIRY
jgi:peptide/nickel transport system permease protein